MRVEVIARKLGLPQATVVALKSAGILTGVAFLARDDLDKLLELSKAEVSALKCRVLHDCGLSANYMNALTLLDKELPTLPTGFAELDGLLGNKGYERGEIVELFGEADFINSLMCCRAAIAAANLKNKVLIIQSNGLLSMESLLRHMPPSLLPKTNEILSMIQIKPAYDLQDLLQDLYALEDFLEIPALVVVDSIGALGQSFLSNKHNQGKAMLSMAGRKMLYLAKKYEILFLITNYAVTQDRSGGIRAALGASWNANVCGRIKIEQLQSDVDEHLTINATILKSSLQQVGGMVRFTVPS
eukprot:m.342947 g.342947  ORF g.342947 m.342947 type:complete len:301 (-) comp22115_c0_seq1:99-1001(-)